MKKVFITILLIVFSVILISTPAYAIAGVNSNEQQVLDYWKQTVGDFKLPTEVLNQAERYFSTSYDMTAEQKDYIISQTDKVLVIVKMENKKSLSEFSATHKSDVAAIIYETATKLKIHLVYDYSSNIVTIYDSNQNTIFVRDASLVKKTGRSVMPYAIAFTITLAAIGTAGTYIYNKKKIHPISK